VLAPGRDIEPARYGQDPHPLLAATEPQRDAFELELVGLALDGGARHRTLLIGLTLGAAAANTVAMIVPWHEWLAARRGRILLDLWCGGLIAFVALLVVNGGSNFALLLFLAVPFIAVVQSGWRRSFWLGVSAGTCTAAAALIPLSVGATAMRLALVAAVVGVALLLSGIGFAILAIGGALRNPESALTWFARKPTATKPLATA